MKEDLINKWIAEGIVTEERILDAFRKIRREDFILADYSDEAYGDYPLPILSGQTISQPTTIMIMTQALMPKHGQKILEIGAGSGYQAAVLAEIVRDVNVANGGHERPIVRDGLEPFERDSELPKYARHPRQPVRPPV